MDAIARHHAYWWESDGLASVPWLKAYTAPPFPETLAGNFADGLAALPGGSRRRSLPELRAFGERFPSLVPWYLEQIARPPITFCHGDLRLDQLFFAVGADDPPVTALDWQITSLSRGRLRPRVLPEPEPRHRDPAQL